MEAVEGLKLWLERGLDFDGDGMGSRGAGFDLDVGDSGEGLKGMICE